MPLAPRTLAILVAAILATSASVLVVHAALTGLSAGSGTDYGVDTNGDGKFDWLVVEADVSLPSTGTWTINAVLSSSTPPATGSCLPTPAPMTMATVASLAGPAAQYPIAWAYERYFFTSGTQTVRFAFNGTEINRASVDGPYSVELTMYPGDYPIMYARPVGGSVATPVPATTDQITWPYTTRAYAASDFNAPVRPAYFAGPHMEAGVDVNGDGLYDLLSITADVHVAVGGNYSVSGNLWWSSGPGYGPVVSLGYAYATVGLVPGDTSVTLAFRGDTIRAANVDGPYNFSLVMYGPTPPPYFGNGTAVLSPSYPPTVAMWPAYYPDNLCGTTQAYRAVQFDTVSETAVYTGAFQEVTPDWDRDGLYDALTIRAEVHVYAGGVFALSGVLHAGATLVSSVNQTAWLGEGTVWAEWTFPGYDIHTRGLDGPYLATLSLQPAAGRLDPIVNYTTAAYKASSFDADTACYNCTVTP